MLVLALSFAVSALFIWLVLRQLDLSELVRVLGEADLGWICAAVACFAIGYMCRIQRWRIMLTADQVSVGFGQAAVPFLASIATNNVLPFRVGDALRTFAFREWLGIGAPVVLATLVVERLLDMLSLLLALGVVLLIFREDGVLASEAIGVGANTLIVGALVLTVILLRPQTFEGLARRMVALIGAGLPQLEDRLDRVVRQVFSTLRQQARGARMLHLMLWSLVAWAFEGAVFYATACALPGMTQTAAAWLAFPIATLSTLIPSMPGHVGTFDFFASQAAALTGNPAVVAAAFALLVHFILWITATLAGGVCFLIWIAWRHDETRSPNKDFSQ
jgi:uncharacterized protein (TIRG00374 family)